MKQVSLSLDVDKVIQISAEFLRRLPDGRTTRLILMKFLYLANRKSIEDRGVPMIPDQYSAMENGPVLSETLNLIRKTDRFISGWKKMQARWNEVFDNAKHSRRNDDCVIVLSNDPGTSRLSKYDRQVIVDLIMQYSDSNGKIDENRLLSDVHKLPEYLMHDPRGRDSKKSEVIPLADIYEAVGRQVDPANIVKRQREIDSARAAFHKNLA